MSAVREKVFGLIVAGSAAGALAVNFYFSGWLAFGRLSSAAGLGPENRIFPSEYAFGIWKPIFLGLIAFALLQALPSKAGGRVLARTRPWVFLALILNSVVVLSHRNGLILPGFLATAFQAAALAVAASRASRSTGTRDVLLIKAPIGVYFGWTVFLTAVNGFAAAGYFGFEPAAAAGLMAVAALTALGVWVRFRLNSLLFPVSIAWGLTGVAVQKSGETVLVAVCAFAVMGLLFAAFWGFVRDR